VDAMAARRRRRRTRTNYYASTEMKRAEKAALRRASKIEGLADEIALFRLELKKAMDDEEADKLKLLADGVETLARAVAAQKKAVPEGSDWVAKYEEALIQINEQLLPEYDERLRKRVEADNARWREETRWKPPAEEGDGESEDQG